MACWKKQWNKMVEKCTILLQQCGILKRFPHDHKRLDLRRKPVSSTSLWLGLGACRQPLLVSEIWGFDLPGTSGGDFWE